MPANLVQTPVHRLLLFLLPRPVNLTQPWCRSGATFRCSHQVPTRRRSGVPAQRLGLEPAQVSLPHTSFPSSSSTSTRATQHYGGLLYLFPFVCFSHSEL